MLQTVKHVESMISEALDAKDLEQVEERFDHYIELIKSNHGKTDEVIGLSYYDTSKPANKDVIVSVSKIIQEKLSDGVDVKDKAKKLKFFFENMSTLYCYDAYVYYLKRMSFNEVILEALSMYAKESHNTLVIDYKDYLVKNPYYQMVQSLLKENKDLVVTFRKGSEVVITDIEDVDNIKNELGAISVIGLDHLTLEAFIHFAENLSDGEKSDIHKKLAQRPMMWRTLVMERTYEKDKLMHKYNLLFE